jgi:hypothetical protein
MPARVTSQTTHIDVVEVKRGTATFRILGATPLIMEAYTAKAKRQLLLPSGRMNPTEKATNLKHNPLEEYRESAVTTPHGPTLLAMPATAFKDAIRTAALDLAGVSKAEIGRLTYVEADDDNMVPIWGIPALYMTTVRSSDIGRTPDIRTRPVIRHWATILTVHYVMPKMTEQAIARLIVAAGITAGVGGWRPEKGSGNFGTFDLVADSNNNAPAWELLAENTTRADQEDALRNPSYYDRGSQELMEWYDEEIERRRRTGSLIPTRPLVGSKRKNGPAVVEVEA